jgi:nucleoid DNA-binding protein
MPKAKKLTKTEFCELLFKEYGYSKTACMKFLQHAGEMIAFIMSKKTGPSEVSLGFVKFKKKHIKARTYTLPSGKRVKRKARKTVRASFSPTLRKKAKN